MRSLLAPLARRDFALLWAGATASSLGDGIFLVAVAWQTYELANVPTALSLVGIAGTAPMLAFLLLGGTLSDRFSRRRLMLFADLLRTAAIGLLALLAFGGQLQLWQMIALVAVSSVGTALFQPASVAIVPELVEQRLLASANSLFSLTRTLSIRVGGPALGGVAVALIGGGGAFALDAGSFLVSAAALWMINGGAKPAVRASRHLLSETLEGVAFVRSEPWLWGTLLAAAGSLLFYTGPTQALVPYLVKNFLQEGPGGLGLVFGAGGTGAVICSLLLGRYGLPVRRLSAMYLFWFLATLSPLGYALSTELWQMAAAGFVGIGAMTGGGIIWMTLLQERVPNQLLGRVTSLDTLVSFALVPLSMALTGPAAAFLGARPALLLAGLLGSAILALFYLALPAMRLLDRPVEPLQP